MQRYKIELIVYDHANKGSMEVEEEINDLFEIYSEYLELLDIDVEDRD